jgi:hypothetical protein
LSCFCQQDLGNFCHLQSCQVMRVWKAIFCGVKYWKSTGNKAEPSKDHQVILCHLKLLVGGCDLPLWKIWKSVGMMTFPVYGKIVQMFQTTNQVFVCYKYWFSRLDPSPVGHSHFSGKHQPGVDPIGASPPDLHGQTLDNHQPFAEPSCTN